MERPYKIKTTGRVYISMGRMIMPVYLALGLTNQTGRGHSGTTNTQTIMDLLSFFNDAGVFAFYSFNERIALDFKNVNKKNVAPGLAFSTRYCNQINRFM